MHDSVVHTEPTDRLRPANGARKHSPQWKPARRARLGAAVGLGDEEGGGFLFGIRDRNTSALGSVESRVVGESAGKVRNDENVAYLAPVFVWLR